MVTVLCDCWEGESGYRRWTKRRIRVARAERGRRCPSEWRKASEQPWWLDEVASVLRLRGMRANISSLCPLLVS